MDKILHTKDLAVGYDHRAVIREIALSVHPGEIVTLIGPNGAGKSTILKSIANQLEPIAGTVYMNGQSTKSMTKNELAKHMSMVMTERVTTELMSCEEVVAMGRYPYTGRLGILSKEDQQVVDDTMELTHVKQLKDCDFNRISDGQKQRVMLAKAICQNPKVLVLDEPTSFLDIRYKLEFMNILHQLVSQKKIAVVMSLHELDLAQKVSDKVLCIRNGRVERYGTVDEIFREHDMEQLFDVEYGSYLHLYGSMELQPVYGTVKTFVIGGMGKGIFTYRKLQKQGIPFAAGVIHENDLDYPVAKALAQEVIAEQAFEPISDISYERALSCMLQCENVICCVPVFGTMNRKNGQLLETAQKNGIRIEKLSDIS